jgi:hypothetical protein
MRDSFPRIIYACLLVISDAIVTNQNARVTTKHALILETTCSHKPYKVSRRPVLDTATNLASRTLTIEEHNIRSNGLHHVYTTDIFDQSRFVCNTEYFYSKLLILQDTISPPRIKSCEQ